MAEETETDAVPPVDLWSPPAAERIKLWGHRGYVGGNDPETWYGIGRRQYHFLVSRGLIHSSRFLDVACGSLRLGQYLIPMLDAGHYFGLEGEEDLVRAGLEQEMLFDVAKIKQPKFAINYDFDLSTCDGYDFAIAQSLFTHLTREDILRCFTGMRPVADPGSQFFFTFFEGEEDQNPDGDSHANRNWRYRFETLKALAEAAGFECTYIGDWGHERSQMMAVATPAG